MLRIAVVEDEAPQAQLLEDYLNRYSRESGEALIVRRFPDAVTFLLENKQTYDIVFMDIEMPDMSGMDAAAKLRETDDIVTIIFVTNMAQYALKGYDVGALDFIVKPVSYYSFSMKMRRAVRDRKIKQSRSEELSLAGTNGVRRVAVSAIKYVEVAGHHLIFHTLDGDIDVLGTLNGLEKQLGRGHFSRCSKSFLVNLEHVTEVNAIFCVVGGDKVQISRRRRKAFVDDLTLFVGGE